MTRNTLPAMASSTPSGSPPPSTPTRPARKALWVLGALLVLAAVGAGAWWWGMTQGMAMMAAPEAVASATADPSQWTIPQGEAATRRHIQAGLKAGDIDPATGLRIQNYHDPMVPGKNFDAPAKSPFMDMMLVPRYVGSGGGGSGNDANTVSISPRTQQNLGLRTASAELGSLTPEISVTGNVIWNERDQVLLQARATGFIETLHVRATLDRVTAGARLAEIYVPSWVAAQEDFLALSRMQGADLEPLRDAARQRMRLAGMSPEQIDAVVRGGHLQPRYTLRAPQAGTVTELMMRPGMTVMPGMTLLRIQGTSTVWAEGEVPESQAALLRPGTKVSATSPAMPGQTFEGRVQALLPEVAAATRTLKARMELANPGGRLVPGMFVQMRFAPLAEGQKLLVPSDAIIHTGRRSLVMLAEADGRFRPVEVKTGRESAGRTEVLAGLQAGQQVVLSGNFLIDSEASLRGVEVRLNRLDAAAGGAAGGAAGDAADGATAAAASASAPQTYPTHQTPALVDALDGDTVTLTHPPIPALKWPEMQMDFRLPPAGQRPADLAAGQRVQIEFQMQDGDVPQITAIRPAPAVGATPAAAGAASGPAR